MASSCQEINLDMWCQYVTYVAFHYQGDRFRRLACFLFNNAALHALYIIRSSEKNTKAIKPIVDWKKFVKEFLKPFDRVKLCRVGCKQWKQKGRGLIDASKEPSSSNLSFQVSICKKPQSPAQCDHAGPYPHPTQTKLPAGHLETTPGYRTKHWKTQPRVVTMTSNSIWPRL
jgi:hypothetical protein